jgi:hypothetical protein
MLCRARRRLYAARPHVACKICHVVCCTPHVALPHGACRTVHAAARCTLHAECRTLSLYAARCLLYAARCMLYAARCMLYVVCHTLSADATRCLLHAARCMPQMLVRQRMNMEGQLNDALNQLRTQQEQALIRGNALRQLPPPLSHATRTQRALLHTAPFSAAAGRCSLDAQATRSRR